MKSVYGEFSIKEIRGRKILRIRFLYKLYTLYLLIIHHSKFAERNIYNSNKCVVKWMFKNIGLRISNITKIFFIFFIFFGRHAFHFNCNYHENNNVAMKSSKSEYNENMTK